MKNFYCSFKTVCIVVITLTIVGCSKSGGRDDYRNALPSDAFITISLNPEALAKKANVGDFQQSPFYDEIRNALLSESDFSGSNTEYLLSIIRNPSESGLDMDKDVYIFVKMGDGYNAADPDLEAGLVARIKDAGAFEKFAGLLVEEGDAEIIRKDGMNIIHDGNSVAVYDDNTLLVVNFNKGYEENLASARRLMNQSRSESLLGLKNIDTHFDRRNDIGMIMVPGNMPESAKRQMAEVPMFKIMEGTYLSFDLNFEKGRIEGAARYYYQDKEAEKRHKELLTYTEKQNGDLLRYIPERSLMTFGAGVKGDKLYDMLTQLPQFATAGMLPEVREALAAFEGDMIVSFTGMKKVAFQPLPTGTAILTVKNRESISDMLDQLRSLPITTLGQDQYMFGMFGFEIHFGVKDNLVYVTTDPQVRNALNGERIDSMVESANLFKGSMSTVLMDFKFMRTFLSELKMSGYAKGSGLDGVIMVLGLFDTFEMQSTDYDKSTLVIQMADRDRNALETLFHTISDIAMME